MAVNMQSQEAKDAVDELTMLIIAGLTDEMLDDEDVRPVAHKLVRLGWARTDNNLASRVARLEAWAQGKEVVW